MGKERTHRQDLQNCVVDYDRKLAALESEKKRLLLDREELESLRGALTVRRRS